MTSHLRSRISVSPLGYIMLSARIVKNEVVSVGVHILIKIMGLKVGGGGLTPYPPPSIRILTMLICKNLYWHFRLHLFIHV